DSLTNNAQRLRLLRVEEYLSRNIKKARRVRVADRTTDDVKSIKDMKSRLDEVRLRLQANAKQVDVLSEHEKELAVAQRAAGEAAQAEATQLAKLNAQQKANSRELVRAQHQLRTAQEQVRLTRQRLSEFNMEQARLRWEPWQ